MELWEHQQDAIKLATEPYPRSLALFMEPGTGKTLTTIRIIENIYPLEEDFSVLIFAPIATLTNWKREFEKYSHLRCEIISGRGIERAAKWLQGNLRKKEQRIFVAGYESLYNKEFQKSLELKPPLVLVFDESQRIKSMQSKRTKAAVKAADAAKYVYLLSGTPILNSSMDIFAQYRALDRGQTFGKYFINFRQKYFYDKNSGMPTQKYFPNWQPNQSTFEEFNRLIYKKAFRALKKDCLDLPPMVKKTFAVTMSAEASRAYRSMQSSWIAYFKDSAFVAQIALTKALRLQQIVSGFCTNDDGEVINFEENPRAVVLSDLLEDLTPNHKVIVWACYQQNYEVIRKICKNLELGFCELVGGMTDKARTDSLDAFENDPAKRVMIANQGAGGVGVNMIAASYAIYYSRNFSLEQDIQSEARNYRGGSDRHESITRIDLVCEDTIDEVVLNALLRKQNVSDAILNWKGKR
jgi:SNF2 family DNA or RNA helicase